jgi:cell division protein FtsB
MTQENNGKVVNRNIAIGLGLACVILAALVVVSFVNGTAFGDSQTISDLENQVAEQTSKISSLTAQITIQNNQLSTLNDTVSDYEAQIADLTDENSDYANIIALNESAYVLYEQDFTQDANTTTSIWTDTVDYAGYFEVQVQSTSDDTAIQVVYTYNDVNYNQSLTVGTDGTVYFPVLPSAIEIMLSNTGAEINNATVTLIYCY